MRHPYKISCLVMSTKQIIRHSNLSNMENEILLTCFLGNYSDSLGELSNNLYGMFGVEKFKSIFLKL